MCSIQLMLIVNCEVKTAEEQTVTLYNSKVKPGSQPWISRHSTKKNCVFCFLFLGSRILNEKTTVLLKLILLPLTIKLQTNNKLLVFCLVALHAPLRFTS